jgi:bacteriorhodopsin
MLFPPPPPAYQKADESNSGEDWKHQLQQLTFGASLFAQAVTLCLSVAAFRQDATPNLLLVVLILETTVQAVELCWYSTVGVYYWCTSRSNNNGIAVWWRYVDWVITTPIMLVSIFLFSLWEAKLVTCSDTLSPYIPSIALVVLSDWLMLVVGFLYERYPKDYNKSILYLGFVPFVVAFVPLFVVGVQGAQGANASAWPIMSVSITFLLWALYGAVALLAPDDVVKNALYNVLDILSKNVVGLIISSIVLANDFGDVPQCSS